MVGLGPRFAIERAEIGNSQPTVVRACALLDHQYGCVTLHRCHYDLQTGTVTHLRLGQWYPSPFAARQAQGALRERTPQDSVIVVRPPAVRQPAAGPGRAEQLIPSP